jgi:TolB protein
MAVAGAMGAAALAAAAAGGGAAAAADAPARPGEVTIVIAGPGKKLFPIAVPDLRAAAGADKTSGEALGVLRNDLDVSGYFKLLDPKGFLAPPAEGIEAEEIDFEKWFAVGAQGLIKGSVKVEGDTVKLEFRLFVDAKPIKIPKRSYAGPAAGVRDAVHDFCNEVVRYFTGEPGIFGSKIAFTRTLAKGRKEIFVSEMDGHGAYAATSAGSISILPAWAKGGGRLLFTSFLDKNPDLWLKPLGGTAKKISAKPGLNVASDVSPASGLIAATLSFDGDTEICLLDDGGKLVKRLTTSKGIDTAPSFSPDGSMIAFVSDRHGTPQIWVMSADGSGARRLTYRGSYNQSPDWSPRADGKIAFSGRDEHFVFDIFLVDPKTGEIERLTQDHGSNEEPSFSPDGRYLAFTSTRDGGYQIYVMNVEGTNEHPITKGGSNKSPAWGAAPKY